MHTQVLAEQDKGKSECARFVLAYARACIYAKNRETVV